MNQAEFYVEFDKYSGEKKVQADLLREFYDEHVGRSSWTELCHWEFLHKHYSSTAITTAKADKKAIGRSHGGAHNAMSTLIPEKSLKAVLSFFQSEVLGWYASQGLWSGADGVGHWRNFLIGVDITVHDTKLATASGGAFVSGGFDKGPRVFGWNPHGMLGHYVGDTRTSETYYTMGSKGNWLNAGKRAKELV